MTRCWLSNGYALFFWVSMGFSFKGISTPLTIDVPAQKEKWQETLKPTAYNLDTPSISPTDALHHLETLPSITLKKTGGAGQMSSVSFRGQTARNTHLRIDDIPLQDATGNINFSPLFGGATQLISVTPGSQGSYYGSGATGGVVLMETPFLPSSNSLTTEVGSFDSAYAHISHQEENSHTKWVIHGEGGRTSGLPQYGKTRKLGEKGRARSMNIATRVEHHFDAASVFKLTARSHESENKYDTYDTYLAPLPKPQGTQTTNLSLLGISFEKSSGPILHKMNSFMSHQKLKNTGSSPSTILTSGAGYKGVFYPSSRFESTFLGGAEENRINSNKEKKTALVSFYGGWIQRVRLTESLAAEGAMRLDHHEKFGTHPTYSAILSHTHNNTTLRGGIRTGFLNPSVYNLYVTNNFVMANPHLKAEKTRTIDFCIEQKFPAHHLAFQVTPFWTKARKMIHAFLQQGRYQSINLPGQTTITGIESQITYTPKEKIKLRAGHTYVSLDCSQANVNPEFPKHKVHLGLDYRPQENLTLTPEILYISKRRSYGGQTLKEYGLVNISLRHELKSGAYLFGRVDNIFDTRYEQTYGYQTPGRAFYVGTHFYF